MLERLGGSHAAALVVALVSGSLIVGSVRVAGHAAPQSTTRTAPATTTPATTAPATTAPATTAPVTTTTSNSSTSTSTTSTSTTVAPPTTVAADDLIPLEVTASSSVIGAGGTVDFSGRCAVLTPSVEVEIDGPVTAGAKIDGTEPTWTYSWVAPTDEAAIGTYSFRFWCGDRSGFTGTYPDELVRRVDMVASAPPGATPPASDAPGVATELPETE